MLSQVTNHVDEEEVYFFFFCVLGSCVEEVLSVSILAYICMVEPYVDKGYCCSHPTPPWINIGLAIQKRSGIRPSHNTLKVKFISVLWKRLLHSFPLIYEVNDLHVPALIVQLLSAWTPMGEI